MAGAPEVAKWPENQRIRAGYTFVLRNGRIYSIGIPLDSPLMPRRNETVPYFIICCTSLEFEFYKNYVDPALDPWPRRRSDLSFYIFNSEIPDNFNSWIPLRLSIFREQHTSLEVDPGSGELETTRHGVRIEEQFWESSGQIAAIPDLSHALLILRMLKAGPTRGRKDSDLAKIDALTKLIRIKAIVLRIGPRQLWLRKPQFNCKEDWRGPYCAFVFPTDLNTLH
jgi:hypothetical protein